MTENEGERGGAESFLPQPRKNTCTLSLGVDVAQALVPAGSRLSRPLLEASRSAEMSLDDAD
jgi:hypothetical protein